MNKLLLNTLVSASLAAAAAPAALAQAASPESPGTQARHHAQRHELDRHALRMPSERVEARLAYLKTALGITDTQQPLWNAFADTLRRQAREAEERFAKRQAQPARGDRTPPTAIERLERRQAIMAAASARLNEVLAAAKPLYAALSAEQQKIADELLAPRHGGHRHHRGMHGRA
jgi:hypothetical protein